MEGEVTGPAHLPIWPFGKLCGCFSNAIELVCAEGASGRFANVQPRSYVQVSLPVSSPSRSPLSLFSFPITLATWLRMRRCAPIFFVSCINSLFSKHAFALHSQLSLERVSL